MTVSPEQLHVLRLAEAGRDCTMVPLVNGKGSQSGTVGRGATVSTCVRNGWLTWSSEGGWRGDGQYVLSATGREVLKAVAERMQARKEQALRAEVRNDAGWEHGYRCHGLWTAASRYSSDWSPSWNEYRLGRVALGPPVLWDGVYTWLVDKPGSDGVLAEGTATSLKAAKQAVELHVARLLLGRPC